MNPQRAAKFSLQFFSNHQMSNVEWIAEVMVRLNRLEREFNESGVIRVHITEEIEVSHNTFDADGGEL